MLSSYTENSLVEQPVIALFEELGWETANWFYESFNDSPSPLSSPKGRGGLELPEELLTSPLKSLPNKGYSGVNRDKGLKREKAVLLEIKQ